MKSPLMSDTFSWDVERAEEARDLEELYDIREAKRIIVAKPRPVEFLDVAKYGDLLMDFVGLKPNADCRTVDTTLPVILAQDQNGGKFAIDGRHRIAKAQRLREPTIPAVVLTIEETIRIRRS